jgi:malonyl-CoA/methylmalonyl-CoA synthetase
MANDNLYALFAARFPEDRSRIFIETDDGRTLDFAELENTVAHYAGLIRACGVIPGDRVAVQVEKSPEALMLYLACLKSGAVYLPLNSAYRDSEVAYFLSDAEPKIFVHAAADNEWVTLIGERLNVKYRFTLENSKLPAERGTWDENARNTAPMLEFVRRNNDDLAAILYTSGTTGRSKGAMITHLNLASNALTLHRYWGFAKGDVLLHALPLFHVHGLFVACHTALLNAFQGGRMLFYSKFDAQKAAALMAAEEVTVFMGVPTMYTRLLGLSEAVFNHETCRHMRLFVSGSAPLLAETFTRFQARTGHTILERYGMTETGMITSNPLGDNINVAKVRRGGTVGLPLPGVRVRVMIDGAAGTAEAVAGEIGDLQVKGDNVLPGYWRMPEKNVEEFTEDGFFKTGDVGLIDADGYVSIVGRSKDLVISGGFNVYPKEIEILLDAMPSVTESAVIGLPHPDFGEAVVAVVVASANAALNEAETIATLKLQLANFKLPKRVFVVAELPRNAMGKVQKSELRKTYAGTFVPLQP